MLLKYRSRLASAALLIVAVTLWHFLVSIYKIPPHILPLPSAVLEKLITSPTPWVLHIYTTLYEVLLGYAIGCIIGIFGALATTFSRQLREIVYPYLLVAQLAPKIAVAPLLLIWLGYGLIPKIILVFLISFFPMFIDTLAGLDSIQIEHVDLSSSLGATRWQTLTMIQFPNALPFVFAGMKVGMTLAVIGAIVAEFVGAEKGLGYLLIISGTMGDAALTFAALLVVSAVGLLLYSVIVLIERLLLPWYVLPKKEWLREA